MSKPANYLGVITQLERRQNVSGPFNTAVIESPGRIPVFFRQSGLVNEEEAVDLADDLFIFFDTTPRKLEKRECLDATNCSLAHQERLINSLFEFDNRTIDFIRKRAAPELITVLLAHLEKAESDEQNQRQQERIKFIKSKLLQQSASEPQPLQPISPATQQPAKPAARPFRKENSKFLHTVFAANSLEYNQKLFTLLVEGVKSIDDEDSFTQALFLLDFNDQLKDGQIANLTSSFYSFASHHYRLQFWLQGAVPYCDTKVLMAEFANADELLKEQILHRFQGDDLSLFKAVKGPEILSAGVEAYFSNIKTKILEQLSLAQSTIAVAVAWFTNDELFGMLCSQLERGVSVELIINNDYINNWEHGLPFQRFIDLGGQLYLSEYPSMMHHKFCLIDDIVLFNGSYNWTYYAELRNEENTMLIKNCDTVVSDFRKEFNLLKDKIGKPEQTIVPFEQADLQRFERMGFREYISKDIELKVSYARAHRPAADVQNLAKLIDAAVKIDGQNSEAQQLQKELAPAVTLDKHVAQAQLTVQQVMSPVKASEVASDHSHSTTVENLPASVQASAIDAPNEVPQPSLSTNHRHGALPTAPAPSTANSAPAVKAFVSVPNTAAVPSPAKQSNPINQVKPIANTVSMPAPNPPISPVVAVDTKFSIPESQIREAMFPNLKLVFALDYSGSMGENGGYNLYASGKVQKVIDMVFGISKGLTTSGQIDMFLFEEKSTRLPAITVSNYSNYVKEVVMKYPMAGTNIFAPIQDIHNKYIDELGNTSNVFVILITDGENGDAANNAKIKTYFTNNGNVPVFWQFVGLGAKFAFLEEVNRIASNAAFFNLNDVQEVSNDDVLKRLLQKFPNWFQEAKLKGITK